MSESDLALIQRCVREGRLLWTYHVNMRLRQRRVTCSLVTESVDSYQIIEQYPRSQTSRYLPSCLIHTKHHGEVIHILFALDREGDTVRIVTVYRPDPAEWDADVLRRKKL